MTQSDEHEHKYLKEQTDFKDMDEWLEKTVKRMKVKKMKTVLACPADLALIGGRKKGVKK